MKQPHDNGSLSAGTTSLPQIESVIGLRLKRLGLEAGKVYLAGAQALIEPLQTEVANTQLLSAELVEQAMSAGDSQALQRINTCMVEAGQSMFMSLRSVPIIHELSTAVRDAIARRALDLARKDLHPSGPVGDIPLTLVAVGSHGRYEQTLFTDQDYLFIHGDYAAEDAVYEKSASEYFCMLGSLFVKNMEEAGIRKCSSGIMPDNCEWRGSSGEWCQRLFTPARFQHDDWAKSILALIILSDARYLSGSLDLWVDFAPRMRTQIRENHQTVRNMARVASAMRLAKGFFHRFAVEAEGPNKGAFNLKLLAWKPLVMCIRVLAVHFGVENTSTLVRIEMLQEKGIFSAKMASSLTDAYHTITCWKVLQQIKKIKKIIDDENYINPYELVGSEREELYTAIMKVAELQNMVRKIFSVA